MECSAGLSPGKEEGVDILFKVSTSNDDSVENVAKILIVKLHFTRIPPLSPM
jgi:hypothetical protein